MRIFKVYFGWLFPVYLCCTLKGIFLHLILNIKKISFNEKRNFSTLGSKNLNFLENLNNITSIFSKKEKIEKIENKKPKNKKQETKNTNQKMIALNQILPVQLLIPFVAINCSFSQASVIWDSQFS